MDCTLRINFSRLIRILACCSLLTCAPIAFGLNLQIAAIDESALNLVRVNILIETRGAGDTVEVNGQVLNNYSPVIIQEFPSTGIVLDRASYVMTFLGYRWTDIDNHEARVVVTTGEGQEFNGKLVGIDQNNGVAVVRLLSGKLPKTPVCPKCEIKDGAIVIAPILREPNKSEYQEARILSVGMGARSLDPDAWVLKVNRPLPDIGLPILSEDQRVLGFIASLDPMDMQTVVFPISQMLSSAEKILKTNGDIRVGWLGVYLDPSRPAVGPGVSIKRIEQGSPAQKAGLTAGDLLLKFNGHEIKDELGFVQLVQSAPIGSKVKLNLVRQGRPMSNTAMIEAYRPAQPRGRLTFSLTGSPDPNAIGIVPQLTPPNPRLLMGLSTEFLNPPLAEGLQLPQQTGLLVMGVAANLPAEQAGILPGDVIISVDGQPVIDPAGFASFLLTHNWGSQSVLKVIRKGVERTIVVQLPGQDR